MTNYRKDFKNYLNDLAVKKPSPGGGSVAALAFCLGTSLMEKSLRYSSKNYRNLNDKLKRLRELRLSISKFIDLDGDIFGKVMRAKGKQRKFYLKKSDAIIRRTAAGCRQVISLAKTLEAGVKNCIISDFRLGRELIALALIACDENRKANKAMLNR